MPGPVAAYVVAISMMLVCGLCALALIRTIDRFDPPDARELPEPRRRKAAV